jgi:hypothetical protein
MNAPLLAEFETAEKTVDAARRVVHAGHRPLDAFTPFSVAELSELIPRDRCRIRPLMLIMGLGTAAFAYWLQWYSAVFDYPLDVGGRALNSWPVFLLVPFEVAMLAAALAGFVTFLWECGLPRLYDSIFAVRGFERATQDRFFLLVQAQASAEPNALRHCLESLGAVSVTAVPP